MRPLSLRARLLAGALFWTLGLFIGAVTVSAAIMARHSSYPSLLHHLIEDYRPASLVLMVLCLVLGFLHVRGGVTPIVRLRRRLADVHAGREPEVGGVYPTEVQPLVDDLNALLAHRDTTVRRAIAKAGDLAHGLKTPLAVLAHEAERARSAGHGELAATLAEQVDRMRRQIDYHLAQARAAASGATPGAQCRVYESADALARTLATLHAGRGITLQLTVDPHHSVRVQREDLDEMLGNVLDNACKWTRTRVTAASAAASGWITIDVDDDGPGVPAAMRDVVLQRGVRADEAAPGSGLGLAIVRDLVELYGGAIVLGAAPVGGLRVTLRLPRA